MAKIYKAAKNAKPAVKSLVGKTINITIERLDLNGVGVGRYQKKSVFVANTLIGEQVATKVVEQKSKFIKGQPIKINQLSELREKPRCEHYYQCGGCELQHLSHQGQLSFKQRKVDELFGREGIDKLPWLSVVSEDIWHYRRKARIGVQYNKLGEAIVGFRRKDTNTLTPIKTCPVLDNSLVEIFSDLNNVISQLELPNAIGHIEVIAGERPSLVVRQLLKLTEHVKQVWQNAADKNNWQVSFDTGKSIVALNEQLPEMSYALGDIDVKFTASDFIQVNASVNQAMIKQAIEWLTLTEDDTVLDLFCGLGNFSLPMAQHAKHVVGVEGVEAMVQSAGENAAHNGITNAQFYQLDLNSNWQNQAWSNVPFNKVLLDPARAGAFEACQQLLQFSPEKILYVSCEPASLARDAKALVSAGYQIKKIGLIDMFSQTKHVETMVLFAK
ncbi:23S rRNA (uracil(1939)-C(5))-methyltransferase RlmD [Thalassotalea sp. M1531]|uniref:23S rRNA (uracil(1939)-C(5))-methyltransferase RlmD n=1 Tax=Thalassotalea algicola TaxID=2716224 RepID=A0A7Y0Q5Q1_9GAMM|nr:23S rRNA (uracil(1939)-C(5))-methyltransferase RlmD [Thalassotalea algicola]NMP29957.1 23S rRNA (uracil(1939)-C(5))-methyltransferase RlmD [Thalassotalea algicola]